MLYLHEVSSLYFHSRHTGRWRQGPALSLSACEPASSSVLTFISEDMSLSTVHVEPNRVSVPAGGNRSTLPFRARDEKAA